MRNFVSDWGKGAFNLNDESEERICMECHKSFITKYRGPVPVCWSCRMVK